MRKSLLAALAAGALLAGPGLALAQEPNAGEKFVSLGSLTVPGNALTSFDISWVDTTLNFYLLADRSNKSIDVVPITSTTQVFQVIPGGNNAFAGSIPTCPIANACNGPNGVLTVLNPGAGGVREAWIGDGPTNNTTCGADGTICSTVKVFNTAAQLTHTISTGGGFRADELCFAPVTPTSGNGMAHGLIQVANDADSPPFVSWIPTDGQFQYTVIAQVQFPTATNGIEQCQFDPRTARVYLNIPEISGPANDSVDGEIVTFNPNLVVKLGGPVVGDIGNGGVVGLHKLDVTLCAGPQGMAIVTAKPFAVLEGCNAPTQPPGTGLTNSGIVGNFSLGAGTGAAFIGAVLTGQGGSDEVWFDPVSTHCFLANGGFNATVNPAQFLAINDCASGTTAVDINVFVGFTGAESPARRSHSVAAWSGTLGGTGLTYTIAALPVSANGGTPTPGFSSTLCRDPSKGCIAVFGTTPIPVPDPAGADTN